MKNILFIFFLVICFAGKNFSQGKKPAVATPVYTVVEEMPAYIGGEEAMIKFLGENIKYPEKAKKKGIQGTVLISFIIDEEGNVTNAQIRKGIKKVCDEEALRVVKLMPKWKPGKQSGKPVKVQFIMPVNFTLEK
ncbi:MAG: energy transducer TonB [Bacteroidales bacterium]|nr:energy transducer TonB [Bacteroidales bacterium]